MTISAKRPSITYIILAILLMFRFSTSVAGLIDHGLLSAGTIPDWVGQFEKWSYLIFLLSGFPLIAVVMILNKDNLGALNIDRPFLIIFLCSGLPIILETLAVSLITAVLPVMAAIWIIYNLWRNQFAFGDVSPSIWRNYLLVVSAFAACIIAISSFLNIPRIGQYALYFFSDTVPNSIYEEVIYRGILWMFLRDVQWNEQRIFLFQAFLFWASHMNYLLGDPLNFWIFTPLVSLLLGYIVLRTRSITPSSITHTLINLLYGLVLLSL